MYRTIVKRLGINLLNYPIIKMIDKLWNLMIFLVDN